VRCSMNCIRSF